MEYPTDEHNVPTIWVDYEDIQDLKTAGVGHVEYIPTPQGTFQKVKRWMFGGYLTLTVASLTSLERDRIMDLLVALIAFGEDNPQTQSFRAYIENNPFIAAEFNWDLIKMTSQGANPGTPWGTEDIMYEKSMAITVIGEFVSDPSTTSLVKLSDIAIHTYDTFNNNEPTGDDGKGRWV
jgi:hypothetical protein